MNQMRLLALAALPVIGRAALAGSPVDWAGLDGKAQSRVCRAVKRHLSQALNGPAAQRLLRTALERGEALELDDLDRCIGADRREALRRCALGAAGGQVAVRPEGEGGGESGATGEVR